MSIVLTREEAIDKLFYDDLDNIIIGHQDGDNSYLFDLLTGGFKGYDKFNNRRLMVELYERFDISHSVKL